MPPPAHPPPSHPPGLGARARVLWLVAVAMGSLAAPWPVALGLLVLHLGWCLQAGARPVELGRSLRRLATFLVFGVVSLALFPGPGGGGDGIGVGPLTVHPAGALQGLVLAMRLGAVVVASQAVRLGAGAESFARGLRLLGMPVLLSLSLDAVLGLLADGPGGGRGRGRGRGNGGGGGGGRGRGRGHGGGGGRHHRRAEEEAGSRREQLRRYFAAVRGQDPDTFARPLARAMDRAAARLRRTHPDLPPEVLQDVAVISGVAAVMISLRWFKTLPGLPFAPGHKNAVLLPLYLVASELTHSRFGATVAGLTMGTVGFLSGDGRYGLFEVVKHAAPGLMADGLQPLAGRLPGPRLLVYIGLGGLLAIGRLGAELSVAVALGMPASFYALMGGVSVTHLLAGALSGFVSTALLAALDRVAALRATPEEQAEGPPV